MADPEIYFPLVAPWSLWFHQVFTTDAASQNTWTVEPSTFLFSANVFAQWWNHKVTSGRAERVLPCQNTCLRLFHSTKTTAQSNSGIRTNCWDHPFSQDEFYYRLYQSAGGKLTNATAAICQITKAFFSKKQGTYCFVWHYLICTNVITFQQPHCTISSGRVRQQPTIQCHAIYTIALGRGWKITSPMPDIFA